MSQVYGMTFFYCLVGDTLLRYRATIRYDTTHDTILPHYANYATWNYAMKIQISSRVQDIWPKYSKFGLSIQDKSFLKLICIFRSCCKKTWKIS